MLWCASKARFFSLLGSIPLYGHNWFIHSLVHVPVDWLWLLAILNKATMNILVRVFG